MANTLMRSSSMSNGTTQTSKISSSTLMSDFNSSKSSIPTTTCTPVPTKPFNNPLYPGSIVPTPSTTPVPPCPPLDELVNDSFLESIGQLEDPGKIAFVKKFNDYLIKQHCQENLHFLIDIFNYELCYNRVFPDLNTYPEKERLNSTPNPSLQGYLSSNTSTDSLIKVKRDSISTLTKRYSIASEDLDPQEMFVSTIDDLDAHEYAKFNVNIWEEFGQRQMDNDDDEEDSSQYAGEEGQDTFNQDEEVEILNSKWQYLMNTYIRYESIQQINITQKLFKEIVEESARPGVHNPLTLIKARNETLRLLKENGYLSFVSHCKREYASSNQPSPTVGTLPNSPSSLSLNGSSPTSPTATTTVTPSIVDVFNPSDTVAAATVAKPKSIPRTSSPLHSGNSSSGSLVTKLSSLPKRNIGGLFSSTYSSGSENELTPSTLNSLLGHLKIDNANNNQNNSRSSRTSRSRPSSPNENNSTSSVKDDLSSSFKFWSRRK
ncbi:hypothetical protein JA1_002029 [Spathaspora sp. JA1]|nr:hypothetical protein JA1_002029 [Spathaspora sp. JA1]